MVAGRKAISRAAALIGAALVLAAAHATATPILRHGTVKFTGTVTIKNSLPSNAVINGEVRVAGGGSRFVTATAKLKRSGNAATMAVSLPYSWELETLSTPISSHMIVAFTVNTPGGVFTEVTITFPMPADGTTTAVALPASL